MVRSKSVAWRSLPVIDYNHPSVCFWFFGQVPSNKKNLENAKDRSPQENSFSSPEKKEKVIHPLSVYPEIPQLTDLQIYMTEAITYNAKNKNKSCNFETIYEYVSKRWRNIKRRDGTSYTTDCRRAIQANLRHNPNHVPLFRRDKENEGYWTLCNTLEEAEEASRERSSKKRIRGDRELRELKDELSKKEIIDHQTLEDENVDIESEEKNENTEDHVEDKLTIEDLICDCIQENSGSCHLELIVPYIIKNRQKLLNPPETNYKNLVLQSLLHATTSESKKMFKRDIKNIGWWMMNLEQFPEDSAGRNKRNSTEQELEEEKSKDSQMTELQILIIEAIDKNGRMANFDQIYDHVSKSFDSLRRRNGLPYTSECKRAIQASLSNNPATRPFFKIKKDPKKGTTYWTLAKRSIDFLETRNELKIDGEGAFQESKSSPHTLGQEEEIVDEDEFEDQIDQRIEMASKEEFEENPPKTIERDLEERHLYPHRMRRARMMKGKVQSKNSSIQIPPPIENNNLNRTSKRRKTKV